MGRPFRHCDRLRSYFVVKREDDGESSCARLVEGFRFLFFHTRTFERFRNGAKTQRLRSVRARFEIGHWKIHRQRHETAHHSCGETKHAARIDVSKGNQRFASKRVPKKGTNHIRLSLLRYVYYYDSSVPWRPWVRSLRALISDDYLLVRARLCVRCSSSSESSSSNGLPPLFFVKVKIIPIDRTITSLSLSIWLVHCRIQFLFIFFVQKKKHSTNRLIDNRGTPKTANEVVANRDVNFLNIHIDQFGPKDTYQT